MCFRFLQCFTKNKSMKTNNVNKTNNSISSSNENNIQNNIENKSNIIVLQPLPITWNETIPFVPPITNGYVIKVYDGDTITIASKLPYINSPLYRFSVRLKGIDCAEMTSKNQDEKLFAEFTQKALEILVLHKNITLKNIGTEKYGRILADIYLDDLHINKFMIENRYALTYNGKTKITPKSWNNYYKTGQIDQ